MLNPDELRTRRDARAWTHDQFERMEVEAAGDPDAEAHVNLLQDLYAPGAKRLDLLRWRRYGYPFVTELELRARDGDR